MSTETQTPVESILIPSGYNMSSRAKSLCGLYGITTAQELATYSRFGFFADSFRKGGTLPMPTEPVFEYLSECLKKAGLSFSKKHPQVKNWASFHFYGKKNTKKDLVAAAVELAKPSSMMAIASRARQDLQQRLAPYEDYGPDDKRLFDSAEFASSVFTQAVIRPYFDELVKQRKFSQILKVKRYVYEAI
jgi:hypothetical protein